MLQIVFLQVEPMALVMVIFLAVVITLYIGSRIRIVKEGTEMIVERLGQYYHTIKPGFNYLLPFVDRVKPVYDLQGKVTHAISTKEQELTYSSKTLYTKDNQPITVNLSLLVLISNTKQYVYGADNTSKLIPSLASRTLYNCVIEMDLDEVIKGRAEIIKKMRSVMDESLASWGITLNHLEIEIIK